ncbi:MAG: HNH endonuclease [Cyanobacteria bacterium HKST-UBA03]|nr:HNH endonuclease [Cyanobacteria bacterium HKST-UBA03]
MKKVLLLNASYEPLNICSWKRAVVLLLKGKATSVEHQGATVNNDMALPSVIRLLYYIKTPYKTIPLTRKNLMHRDKYTCQYCSRRGHNLTIDHVLPRSRGGRDEWENCVVACHHCNTKKGNRTPEEAAMPIKKRPVRPVNFMNFEISKQSRDLTHYQDWIKYFYTI